MSDTVILGISPTFYLKRINPLSFSQKYYNGEYKTINLEYVKNNMKRHQVNPMKQVEIMSTDPLSKRFTMVDRNNNTYTCVTTNNFDGKERICSWCRGMFTHSWIGIPYRVEYYDEETIFYTDGCHCCFECASAELSKTSKIRFNRYNGLYVTADILLETMFERIYPGKKLIQSPNFSLHERNGGSLNDEEFYTNKSIYVETSGIVVIPTKKISLQLQYS
jgi:hypothetical protein